MIFCFGLFKLQLLNVNNIDTVKLPKWPTKRALTKLFSDSGGSMVFVLNPSFIQNNQLCLAD